MASKNLGIFVSLVILFASLDSTIPFADARQCESRSRTFRGMCFFDRNCALVCQLEGDFTGGHCIGFRRRCFCIKDC
uniref:Knottins-like domain-containing protein n=1 Tax=Kalanchoe fedtschenkoi TaxID=63787 RepID=A0A7N0ZW87_KALFE